METAFTEYAIAAIVIVLIVPCGMETTSEGVVSYDVDVLIVPCGMETSKNVGITSVACLY